jgi:ATP-binding protein involved in chromosome partitioning
MNPFPRARIGARHIVMIISAKGGVGKSTLTVNLAAALTARGHKVGIFDADLHGPNIPALLGVRQKSALDSNHPETMFPIEARPDALDNRPIRPLTRYGMAVMSLGLLVGETQAINPQASTVGALIASLLSRVEWGGLDVLLLDMPPGTGEPLNTFLKGGLVDGALLVATRERLAHLDNGRLVGLLRAKRTPILGVVENMTHVICPNCGEPVELYPLPAADQPVYDGAPVLASLPFHPNLIRAPGMAPLPLNEDLPDSGSAVRASLLALADTLLAALPNQPQNAPPDEDCVDCP